MRQEGFGEPYKFQVKEVVDMLKRKRGKNKGAGLSGWTYELLHNALTSGAAGPILQLYTDMLNLVAAGDVPEAVASNLQATPLTILQQGEKQRVVGAPELVFRNMASLVLEKAMEDPNIKAMLHHQNALGVRNGAVVSPLVMEQLLEEVEEPTVCVLSRDIANEFHEFKRSRLFEIVTTNDCLKKLAYLALYLTSSTRLHVRGTDHCEYLESGSIQGSPLSVLFAALVLQPAMDRFRAEAGDKLYGLETYADNIDQAVLAGNVSEMVRLLDECLAGTGYQCDPQKDVLYAPKIPEGRAKRAAARLLPDGTRRFGGTGMEFPSPRQDPNGTILTGVPIGSADYKRQRLQAAVDKTTDALRVLVAKQTPSAIVLKLVTECLIPRLSFLAQVVPPAVAAPILAQFDARVLEAVEACLGMQFTPDQAAQARLPVKLGGLGLRQLEKHCVAANMATLARVNFATPIRTNAVLRPLLTSYNQWVEPSARIEVNEDTPRVLLSTTQKQLSDRIHARARNELYQRLDAEDRKTLDLGSVSNSGKFVRTMSSAQFEEEAAAVRMPMSNEEYGTLVRMRMVRGGQSNFVPRGTPFPNILCGLVSAAGAACGATVDERLHHPTSVCAINKHMAHNALTDALAGAARALGFTVSRAVQLDSGRRADLTIYGVGPRPVAIDVSVRTPWANNMMPILHGKTDTQYHVRKAEADKNGHYREAYDALGFNFVPFVMSSAGGVIGREGRAVMDRLIEEYQHRFFVSRTVAHKDLHLYLQTRVLRRVAQNSSKARAKIRRLALAQMRVPA